MARRAVSIVFGSVLIAAVLIVAGFAGLLVLGAPGDDTRQSFTSPSGARTLHLIETCRSDACTHQAIIETGNQDNVIQVRCGLDILAERPVFGEVEIDWTPEESAVLIRYGINTAGGPVYALDFARDCNA